MDLSRSVAFVIKSSYGRIKRVVIPEVEDRGGASVVRCGRRVERNLRLVRIRWYFVVGGDCGSGAGMILRLVVYGNGVKILWGVVFVGNFGAGAEIILRLVFL